MDKTIEWNRIEAVRGDDFVEYFVFPAADDMALKTDEPANATHKQQLAAMLAQCNAIVAREVQRRQFIWHKDEFQLQIRTGALTESLLYDNADPGKRHTEPLPPHLHGVTHFGDNTADGWFIVYLLSEITRDIFGSIARIIDAEGEFLLIDAVDLLPKWANPDACEQKVYISKGLLHLVQNTPSSSNKRLPVGAAVTKIWQNPTIYQVSDAVQACLDVRLESFHELQTSLHHQIVRLPLGVAALLNERPSLVASAVHAFCQRDARDMKACRTMRYFPPEQRVRTNVRFTRCLYAMVMQSEYVPDRRIGWNLGYATNNEQYKEDLLGVKLACGFEILASQARDACGADENDPPWRVYLRSLADRGYFRDNLEGSAEYKRLVGEAKGHYRTHSERYRTAPLVGREILDLLPSIDISGEQLRDAEKHLQTSDSDEWLNVGARHLKAMDPERYDATKQGNTNGDINVGEFTRKISKLQEKNAQYVGVDDGSSDENDDDDVTVGSPDNRMRIGFKGKACKGAAVCETEQLSSIMGKSAQGEMSLGVGCAGAGGCPGAPHGDDSSSFSTNVRNFLDFVIPEDNWDSTSEMSDYEDEDDLERNFEAMTASAAEAADRIDVDLRAYMAQMDNQFDQTTTTIGQTFESQQSAQPTAEDDFDDIESFQPININVNTLKHMMDNYKTQLSGVGPVSNLLSAMGVGMAAAAPSDEGGDCITPTADEPKKNLRDSPV